MVDFFGSCAILFAVMRDKTIFKLTWKDEDSNRVSSREFENEKGVDHSGSMAALNLAQQADNNGWPWIIEKNGETMCHGQGGRPPRQGSVVPDLRLKKYKFKS